MYKQKGDYAKALEHYNKSLEIRTKIKGPDSIDVATCLNNIGLMYDYKGGHAKALEHYNRCLEIMRNIFGSNSAKVQYLIAKIQFRNIYYSYSKSLTDSWRMTSFSFVFIEYLELVVFYNAPLN